MFDKIFVSPQVKRIVITSDKHGIYELPQDLRIRTFPVGWYITEKLVCLKYFGQDCSLSKSLCSLRSGFQRAIYDAPKFFLTLAFSGAFEMTAHVKWWLMLFSKVF